MTVVLARLSMPEWDSLSSVGRDCVRLAIHRFDMPPGARLWPETRWGWEMLLARFDHARALDHKWLKVDAGEDCPPPPRTFEHTAALIAYHEWRQLAAVKKTQRGAKKVLRSVLGWFSSLHQGGTTNRTERFEVLSPTL